MGSEAPTAVADKVNLEVDASVNRSNPSKKNLGKVPKRIHKAEREKLKRDQLNNLFLDLANVIECAQPNNGKATVLCETTRFLKVLSNQIENFKKENSALLSEFQYITVENNELKEDNSALEAQIGELQSKLEARLAQSKPDLNKPPTEFYQPEAAQGDSVTSPGVEPALPHAPPVYVLPLQPKLHSYPISDTARLASQPASHVSKPHARYPTPADLWPFKVIGEKPEERKETGFCETNLDLNICSSREN